MRTDATRTYLIATLVVVIALVSGCGTTAGPRVSTPESRTGQEEAPPIRLLSRTFVPMPGLASGLHAYVENQQRERVHLLGQFEAIPSLRQRRVMEERLGVYILDTVRENAFFISLPRDLSVIEELLEFQPRLRWIGSVELADKLSPEISDGEVPQHTRRESERAELIVLFFGDVGIEDQRALLERLGARVEAQIGPVNGWSVFLRPQTAIELAGHDIVKWIEPGPPPAQEDNDRVRGVHGVNSDAIRTAPFSVTGAGTVVAHWEPANASLTHGDFSGRIDLGDPPVPRRSRSTSHDESVAADGRFASGEGIYVDFDDSGSVTEDDLRLNVAGFTDGSSVSAGDADIGTGLVFFFSQFSPPQAERFADTGTADFLYNSGEPIYLDADGDRQVSAGDTRLTAAAGQPAGSTVAAGDTDVGQTILRFRTNPHYHATHVAGTVMGDGTESAGAGGSPNQWMGVAPGATLRSYRTDNLSASDYPDAAGAGATFSTNSWGFSHHHQVIPPSSAYDALTSFYDAVVSGRQSDGSASGLGQRILILGSAGNSGTPERHTENVASNGQFDDGESIYIDGDDDGTVSAADLLRTGPTQPIGTALVNFGLDERHDESISTTGLWNAGEAIYRDADASLSVTAGDTRITAGGGQPAGSVVATGDPDENTFLRQFRLWGNVRVPNSAKNTVVVGNVEAVAAHPLNRSSSRGPTVDGRVKPDVAGPGTGVMSTFPGDQYTTLTGTSMSTPAVAGSGALVEEWYRNACLGSGPNPAVVRALLVHTAEDLEVIPNIGSAFVGPDFAFGFGRTRVNEAVAMVPHHRTGTASATGDTDYTVTIGAMDDLKVTLVWDDPAWTANAAPSPATGILQNDLDLLLIAPDGTKYTPWVLDASDPGTPAARSSVAAGGMVSPSQRDRRNPVEQVVVPGAMAGQWTIRVTASTLAQPPQNFVIVSEALPPQASPCSGLTLADGWMRDNTGDTGSVPSSGRLWLSPDLWNRLSDDGGTSHQNPEHGQANHLYANIRNRDASETLRATTIEVWLAPAAVGLAWPDNFEKVGTFPVGNLGPGAARQVGPLEWDPPSPAPSSHFCFYVRVTSPQDPITFSETSSVSTNTSSSNNIVWRNVNVVDLMSSQSVTFMVRNVDEEAGPLDLSVELPEELLEVGAVTVRIDPVLEERWRGRQRLQGAVPADGRFNVYPPVGEDLRLTRRRDPPAGEKELGEPKERPLAAYRLTEPRVRFEDFVLEPGEAAPVTLTFHSDQERVASYPVHVVQRMGGEEVGGILYVVRTGTEERPE